MRKRLTVLLITIAMVMTHIPIWVANAAVAADGWQVVNNNGCMGSAEVDYDIGSNSDTSLKIVCESPDTQNVFMLVTSNVSVEEGKTYSYGGDIKVKNPDKVQAMVDWGTRADLTAYKKSDKFNKYEMKYIATKTGSVKLMILVEGLCEGVWLDNMFFVDEATGENLLSNPDFEEKEEDIIADEVNKLKNEYQQKLYEINHSSEFVVSEIEKVSSMLGTVPVFYKDITVDADASDWGDTVMAYMPTDEYVQLQLYAHDDSREKDLKIDYAFAYDEKYFYMYYNVYDDLMESFSDISTYWRGDSIQFALSQKDEDVGTEFGLIHDMNTNAGRILSSEASQELLDSCIVSTKREGLYTTYEAAIPWSIKYGEKPEKILFNFIVNDNDYAGRAYCIQLAPGIAEGKYNTKNPTLKMVEKGQDWFAWIDGEEEPNIGEEIDYNLYISNYGPAKTFTVKRNGNEENVTIGTGEGYRCTISMTFTENRNEIVTAEVVYDGKSYQISDEVTAKRKAPTLKVANSYLKEVRAYVKEIKGLIEQCEAKGISVDYEKVNLQTLEFFQKFMQEDITNKDLLRINYTYEQLTDIYNEAKQALNAYLIGERDPFAVPKFVDDEFTIDGTLTYAETFDGEKTEKRPVFFVGYGHFAYARNNMRELTNVGSNTMQNEIGPKSVLKFEGELVDGGFTLQNAKGTFTVQTDQKHSGERAAKLVNNSPKASNVYSAYGQNILVHPNTKYKGSIWMKGKNVNELSIATDNFNERVYYKVTDEWQKFEFSFQTKENEYMRSFKIVSSDITDELYIDDISIIEEGSNAEIFNNGGFELHIEEGEEYIFGVSGTSEICGALAKAEAENVSFDVLLSPHKVSNSFYVHYPVNYTAGGGFTGYDVNHPSARQVIGDYLRFVVPIIAKYDSLNSICIANEPTFRTNRIPRYVPLWHEFLKEKHGTIEQLNYLYGSNYKSFEEIEMPLEIKDDPVCVDYQIFNDLQFSDWHKWMTEIVHELAPGIPVHFKVMPYVNSYEHSHARENMTHGYSLEYTADSFDINGCDSHNFLSNGAGNKIQTMWYDFQISIKDAPIFDTEHHIMSDRYDKVYSDEYDAYAVANIWQGALHYRANSVIWAWERTKDNTNLYWGNITQRPKAVWGAGIATYDLNRLAYQIEAFQKEKTEIAILYADSSRIFDETEMNMIYETYNALMCLGKKVKFVTQMQLEKMSNYDILFVPGVDYAKEDTLNAVVDFIKQGGNVVLLGDECFKYTEYGHNADAQNRQFVLDNSTIYPNVDSTGSSLKDMTQGEYRELLYKYLKNKDKILVEVVDANTGKICEDIDFDIAVYNGKLLVNVCNYSEDVDINVLFKGEKVEKIVELRSMTTYGDTVKAEKYIPILLEMEMDVPFVDVIGHWSEDNVVSANFRNLVFGTSESRFEPDKKVTRAEFATMLVRASEMRPAAYKDVFADVSKEDWYAMYLQPAYNAGIIREKMARPNDYITREEMCGMAVRALERKHDIQSKQPSFSDIGDANDITSISKAYGSGIINGYEDNTFKPKDGLTRAEAVAVILNLYNRGEIL